MLVLIAILFLIGALVLIARIVIGMSSASPVFDDELKMPFTCPSCFRATDRLTTWYVRAGGNVRCQGCGKIFKEHPNGLLVEDGNS